MFMSTFHLSRYIVLTQTGEGALGHPISFSRIKMSMTEKNYMTTEREGLAMVYALQKFRHYLLGGCLQMYTDHSALKYLVNKPVLGGKICRWLLLFQEFNFEVIVKPGCLNVGPGHLSRIENGEEATILEDNFLDAQLFAFPMMDDQNYEFNTIIHFLRI